MRNSKVANNLATELVEYDVRTLSIETTAQSLSGGNKQKVVIARELAADLFVIASQLTRMDVGSIEFIHSQIVMARRWRWGSADLCRTRRSDGAIGSNPGDA